MANGRVWPLKLKKRCEAIGWTVVLGRSGHYRVRTHTGKSFSFASSPSDSNAEKQALRQARRYGLDKLEALTTETKERDRLERIRRDRGSVGDAFVEAMVDSETEPAAESKEEGDATVEKQVAQTAGALGYVDAVAIAEKAPAMHETPLTHGKRVPLVDGEELLLADGRVVYRCAKPAATVMDRQAKGTCHRVFDTVHSLKGHITFHSRTTMPVAPGARRKQEREAREAERESARERVARVAQVAARKVPVKPAETATKTGGIVARAVYLTEQFNHLRDELDILGKSANELVAEMRELVRVLPESVADEEVLDKARKYEELRKLIG